MRVLHINSGNLYGGIETLLSTLCRLRHLCPDMEPEFAVCFDGRARQELRESGAEVHWLGGVRISRPWTIWRARRTLASILASRAPDVVVCHSSWNHAIFGPVVKKHGIRLVFWAHGPASGRHWLDRWANRTRADRVIANSRWTQDNFQLFPGERREVVYLPVADTSSMDPEGDRRSIRTKFGTRDDAVVIVQVSRLEAWKGHRLLLDALKQLREVAGWECWIVGGVQRPTEECYLTELRRQATQAGIADRIRFIGQCRDVPRVLAAADIFCQPNLKPEPFGIACVEAMYAGLPVVTTAHGGPLEILDEACGVLIEPGNTQSLAESLRTLVVQPGLRRRLGQSGPARARLLCDPQLILADIAARLETLAVQSARVVSANA